MNDLFQRALPPGFAAGALWALDWQFLPAIPHAEQWKQLGLIIPALWLTGVGGGGLMERGGLLLRLMGYVVKEQDEAMRKSKFRIACTRAALVWLVMGLSVGGLVHLGNHVWPVAEGARRVAWQVYILGIGSAVFHAGLFSCLGVFILLGAEKEVAVSQQALQGGERPQIQGNNEQQ